MGRVPIKLYKKPDSKHIRHTGCSCRPRPTSTREQVLQPCTQGVHKPQLYTGQAGHLHESISLRSSSRSPARRAGNSAQPWAEDSLAISFAEGRQQGRGHLLGAAPPWPCDGGSQAATHPVLPRLEQPAAPELSLCLTLSFCLSSK